MSPRILLLCATRKGFEVLEMVIKKYPEVLAGVSTFREVNVQEEYYGPIKKSCKSRRIPFIQWASFKKNPEKVIKELKINCIVAISWKYFIPVYLNKHLKFKIIVFHDSLLPKYRGFTPLPTAMIKGKNKVGVSVLYAEEKIDYGNIIIQKKMRLDKSQYIEEVIRDITKLYSDAMMEIIQGMKGGKILSSVPQDHSQATYSIWRNPEDCQIDWNNSSTEIYNLVRAVSYPYTGAYSFLGTEKLHIWRSEVVKERIDFEIRNPGKIWELDDLGRPTVVCGQGFLKILEGTRNGRNMLPIQKLRQRFH